MKVAVVLLAVLASAHSASLPDSRVPPPSGSGWNQPPPTPGWGQQPTQGWGQQPTQGWGTPPTQGWGQQPTQGWGQPSGWGQSTTPGWGAAGVLSEIDLEGGVSAVGSGWAGENHAENVVAVGGGGWGGPPAQIVISASGVSEVDQLGSLLQVTTQDEESAASVNDAVVSQLAESSEGEVVDALGLEVSNSQSGWAGAVGEGAAAAVATSLLNVQQLAESLGLAKP